MATNSGSEKLINKKWLLKSRPEGAFEVDRDVELVEEEIDLETVEVPEGKCLLKVQTLSVDAFVRTMMDEVAYHGSFEVGGIVPALGYGIVLKSSKGAPKVGARLMGMTRAQTFAMVSVGGMDGCMPMLPTFGLPPSCGLGLLGVTCGMTAYVGIFSAARPPRKGEVCVVSAAAGAVGNIAAQLAKTTGAKVIGIAGGETKCQWLKDTLKLDGVVNYKDETSTVAKQLDELCPDGINFYFDNVGGEILDDVMFRIAPQGRIVVCGAVSQYSGNLNVGTVRGPTNYLKLAERGATMVGFNVMQYMKSFPMGLWTLRTYYARGLLMNYETKLEGIESYAKALQGLFTGAQIGKSIVELA